MKRVLPCLVIANLSACAVDPLQAPSGHERFPEATETSGTTDASGANDVSISASSALVSQSREMLAAGDTAQAAAAIERALRIEPSNPYLWLELGKVRLAEGNAQQALSVAQKARRLAGPDRAAQEAAEHLIERAIALQ